MKFHTPLTYKIIYALLATVLQNHIYINAVDFLILENARLSLFKVKIFYNENGEKVQKLSSLTFIPCINQFCHGLAVLRRKWLPFSVFLPGEFHGERSLVGYSPWGRKESDTTE